MWSRRSHLLQPLNTLTSQKVTFKWIDVEKKAFYDIKHDVFFNTFLSYPSFNRQFGIHTDDSNYHPGAVVSQEGKPIVSYICKLTEPQSQYTTKAVVHQHL